MKFVTVLQVEGVVCVIKKLVQGYNHIGGSGSRNHGQMIRSPAPFHWITRALNLEYSRHLTFYQLFRMYSNEHKTNQG